MGASFPRADGPTPRSSARSCIERARRTVDRAALLRAMSLELLGTWLSLVEEYRAAVKQMAVRSDFETSQPLERGGRDDRRGASPSR